MPETKETFNIDQQEVNGWRETRYSEPGNILSRKGPDTLMASGFLRGGKGLGLKAKKI